MTHTISSTELAQLREALVEAKGITVYAHEDDEVGCHGCCRELSYRPHAKDCYLESSLTLLDTIAARTSEPYGYLVDGVFVPTKFMKAEWFATGFPLYLAPQPVAVPDGWVLVPVEPTKVQIQAGQLGVTTSCAIAIYKAMLASAPTLEEA